MDSNQFRLRAEANRRLASNYMKNKNNNFKCVFFDFDGTLADSIPALYKVHIDFLAMFGITCTKEDFEKTNGPSLPEIITILKKTYKLNKTEAQLINLYNELVSEAYKKYIKPFVGTYKTLKNIRNKGYKVALVTSANNKIVEEFVNRHELNQYFDNYSFGNEVKKAKPDKAIYELALKEIKIKSHSAVAIEDSYNGVKSAKSAGIYTIGIANNQTEKELTDVGADIVVKKLTDILLFL